MDIIKVSEYNNIYACGLFVDEKVGLYRKNPTDAKRYSKWLHRQLGYLDTIGLTVLDDHPKTFEKLSGGKEKIYAIRWKEFSGNPRILFFTIVEEGEADIFVLLAAFKEGKTGDYKRYIPVAQERMKQILLELKEEQ